MIHRDSIGETTLGMRCSAVGLSAFVLLLANSRMLPAQDAASAPPASTQNAAAPQTPAQCGIPGHHALLEKMTEAFSLTCAQELKLEPLLHDEESVSKPLLNFAAFTPEEKTNVMQQVKVAARKQIRPLLTPDQQVKMDQEIDTVSEGGEGLHKGGGGKGSGGGKRGGGKKADATPVDPFEAQQALSQAISKYAALSDAEKKTLILKVKKASLRPDAPALTPDQAKTINAEIGVVSEFGR